MCVLDPVHNENFEVCVNFLVDGRCKLDFVLGGCIIVPAIIVLSIGPVGPMGPNELFHGPHGHHGALGPKPAAGGRRADGRRRPAVA